MTNPPPYTPREENIKTFEEPKNSVKKKKNWSSVCLLILILTFIIVIVVDLGLLDEKMIEKTGDVIRKWLSKAIAFFE